MPPDFLAFLTASLAEIERSEPEADAAIRRALGGLCVRVASGGSSLVLWCGETGWRTAPDGPADLDVGFDASVVLDLIDGEATLEDAIAGERLRIVGAVDKVATFHDALLIYLEGLVRAPGSPALLRSYREISTSSR